MISLSLKQIAEATHGELIQASDLNITEISTDTRHIPAGALFIALIGERFDAHNFVADAVKSGAAAVLVSKRIESVDCPQILVQDTRIALGLLARYVREKLDLKVAAITGSCGKTTLKEMCSAILSQAAPILATKGNLNNEIGVPLTLLSLSEQHRYGIIELGANHPGEIAWTTSLTKPDVAVVNNVGAAHLAGFGSLQGVAVAKTEIFNGLSEDGIAVINADSEFFDWWKEILTVKTLSFGVENTKAEFTAKNIQQKNDGLVSFTMCTPQGEISIDLPIPGLHNVSNALAAAAVTTSLGMTLAQVKSGLNQLSAVKGRFCVQQFPSGNTLIDDTYNASVKSVMAAIDTLSVMSGYRIFAFGDMGELGTEAEALHRQIGEYAKAKNIDAVLTVGPLSKSTAEAANGLHFENKPALCEMLKSLIEKHKPVTVLAKGARSARMEEIVEFVKSCEDATC